MWRDMVIIFSKMPSGKISIDLSVPSIQKKKEKKMKCLLLFLTFLVFIIRNNEYFWFPLGLKVLNYTCIVCKNKFMDMK